MLYNVTGVMAKLLVDVDFCQKKTNWREIHEKDFSFFDSVHGYGHIICRLWWGQKGGC